MGINKFMKLIQLFEATAADLYRKIDGLQAMIDDKTTTPGEKENAAASIKKLQARLDQEFPGQAKPQPKSADPYANYNPEDDWLYQMARAAREQQDLQDLKKKDPAEYENVMRQKLKKMQDNLKIMRRQHIPGNVETARNIQDYSYRVDRFIREHFPKDWEELEKKRAEQRNKSYAYADKKAKEKTAQKKDDITKAGKAGFKEVCKQYSNILEPFFKALNSKQYRWVGDGKVTLRGAGSYGKYPALDIIATQIPVGDIRKAWNEMTPEIQKQLIEILPKVHTLGRHNVKDEGWSSQAQLDKILNAMKPYQDPNSTKQTNKFTKPKSGEEHDEILHQLEEDKRKPFLPNWVRKAMTKMVDPKKFDTYQWKHSGTSYLKPTDKIENSASWNDLDPEKKKKVQELYKSGAKITMPTILTRRVWDSDNPGEYERWLLGGSHRLAYNRDVQKKVTPVFEIRV